MTLRIELHEQDTGSATGEVRLRAILFNDGLAPMPVSRNAFIGPDVVDASHGSPRPASVEPTFGGPEEQLTLQPFTFYGRERTFDNVADGATFEARYHRPDDEVEITASQPIVGGGNG